MPIAQANEAVVECVTATPRPRSPKTTQLAMQATHVAESPRGSGTWQDPWRKLRTLESFAKTEADGGKDIAAAARVVTDQELRQHLERHAADEVRHAQLFHQRAAELRGQIAASPTLSSESDRSYDLSRGRPSSEVDAHGFFKVGLIDELGEVAYVATCSMAT